jgi:hypothetical protein
LILRIEQATQAFVVLNRSFDGIVDGMVVRENGDIKD